MNSPAKTRLLYAIKCERVPHACFIACPDISESYAIARTAASLFCTGNTDAHALEHCPDFFEPESEPYRIGAIREVMSSLTKRPFIEGRGRAVLFKNADRMDEKCQNALLKTLEEPPEATLFLLTGNEAGLLPTIRSRCAAIRTGTPDINDTAYALRAMGASLSDAKLYSSLSEGVSERALQLFSDADYKALRDNSIEALIALLAGDIPFNSVKAITENKSAPDALTFMLSFMRDMLLCSIGLGIKCNIDKTSKVDELCGRFTIGKINCIIELLTEAKARTALNTPQGLIIDRLFAEISEVL